MDATTKRNYELAGYIMGALFQAGYRPAFDFTQQDEMPDIPVIRLAKVRYSEKIKEELSAVFKDLGFTKTRFHVRPGGSPNVRFHANAKGEEVAIEWDGSGDCPGYLRITVEL